MSLKTRVTDGIRTRDIRNHNPQRNSECRALSSNRWARSRGKAQAQSSVGVPGPETPTLPDWLVEARAHLREHYAHDGLSESCLWALYAAGFGIVGDLDIDAA